VLAPDDVSCPIIVLPAGTDHLYEACPGFQRGIDRPRALPCVTRGCDPLDETVCGWCRRVWKARHR
jgi:hypothetical protein